MAGKGRKGIHRVEVKLASGAVRKYHYAFRGGPCFWNSTMPFSEEDDDYAIAYADVLRSARIGQVTPATGLTSSVIEAFRNSASFVNLSERTKQDYGKFLDRFGVEFGEDPIKIFEEREAVAEIRVWKERWAHSPKQYDYATTVVTRFLNWAMEEDMSIAVHHHVKVTRIYKSDRAHINWKPAEIAALRDEASIREDRIIVAASEAGLTPQDIGKLTRDNVQQTSAGRRLFFKRTKTGKLVSIPLTPALEWLVDTTPEDQHYLVVSLTGGQLTARRASQIVRDVVGRVNSMAGEGDGATRIRDELHLYDMRGTAATELLRAGCGLGEIAAFMGWGLRHAANIIEDYAAVVPEISDEVLRKLMAARRAEEDQEEDADE